jgi:hypothetical protein
MLIYGLGCSTLELLVVCYSTLELFPVCYSTLELFYDAIYADYTLTEFR